MIEQVYVFLKCTTTNFSTMFPFYNTIQVNSHQIDQEAGARERGSRTGPYARRFFSFFFILRAVGLRATSVQTRLQETIAAVLKGRAIGVLNAAGVSAPAGAHCFV